MHFNEFLGFPDDGNDPSPTLDEPNPFRWFTERVNRRGGVNVPFGARGKCHRCACPYFSGTGWVCDRGGGCHHHWDEHW